MQERSDAGEMPEWLRDCIAFSRDRTARWPQIAGQYEVIVWLADRVEALERALRESHDSDNAMKLVVEQQDRDMERLQARLDDYKRALEHRAMTDSPDYSTRADGERARADGFSLDANPHGDPAKRSAWARGWLEYSPSLEREDYETCSTHGD